jgi:hypothetical protein
VVIQIPSVSSAQSYSPEAIDTHRRGVEAFEHGEIEEAIRLFQEAFDVHHGHPVALFNLGECYERLGEVDRAVEYFERYLASEDAEDRATVSERIRNLRARPAAISLRSRPAGAAVVVTDVDENRIAAIPQVVTPAELTLPVGTFILRFELAGAPMQARIVEGGLGRRVTLEVIFPDEEIRNDAAPQEPDEPSQRRVYLEAGGGPVVVLTGSQNVFVTGGGGLLVGYEFGTRRWRFALGGEVSASAYPIDVRQTGARHASSFLDLSIVPAARLELHQKLRLVLSAAVGVGLYVPPRDTSVPVPWAGRPLDRAVTLLHLRPAIALEWLPLPSFGLFLVPAGVDLDIILVSDIRERFLINFVVLAGVAIHI